MPTPSPLEARCLLDKIEALAALTDVPGEITRLYGGEAHRRAIDLVACWMRAAWMRVELDGAGNLIGRYPGLDPTGPVLILGSHIDTVRNAGAYDGTLGVVTALAVVDELHRRGRMLRTPIEVVAFGDEEGVRFPSTLTGSKAIAGRFDLASLDERDADGLSRREILEGLGADPSTVLAAARNPARIRAYLELHIEQGPVLEVKDLPVGVVSAINGARRGTVEISGVAGHSGTLPMAMRHDALAAAAEMILAVEARARAEEGLVATVGRIETPGGAVNVVPGQVKFSLDVRAPDDAQRDRAIADLRRRIRGIAKARGVRAEITLGFEVPATPCDGALQEALAASIAAAGLSPFRLPSGAGHDAMAFRGIAPTAMLFVRCRGGVSHNPAEHCAPEDMALAARILYDSVVTLGDQK